MTHNISSGVILSTKSLVLQGVTRRDSGRYSCLAANARGETMSDPVPLRVQCKLLRLVAVGRKLEDALADSRAPVRFPQIKPYNSPQEQKPPSS